MTVGTGVGWGGTVHDNETRSFESQTPFLLDVTSPAQRYQCRQESYAELN
jgi:hypothetical protein